jgi:hypothetical protein
MPFPTLAELEAGLDHVRAAPREVGVLAMIVRRPSAGERQQLVEGMLDALQGLVGDCWSVRSDSRQRAGATYADMQINMMSARAIALVAGDRSRWPLAGDQLFVDLDLSALNLPPGTRLEIGAAIIEVTTPPHTGCAKFQARYGTDAVKFVNSKTGRALNLRGVNARVVRSGPVREGDRVRRVVTPMQDP